MPAKYTLRQFAKDNIKEIGRYTLKHHGKSQRNIYLTGLKDRFEQLAVNPNLGRIRYDIKEGCHCYAYQKHIIFYRKQSTHIEILAVLHERMLPNKI